MPRTHLARRAALTAVAIASLFASAAHADPVWIWNNKKAKGREAVTFKTTIDLPTPPAGSAPLKTATLTFTCDNGAIARINGQGVAENPDWQRPTTADVAKFLKPGANDLVIEATNKGGSAALIAKAEITLADGKKLVFETNENWLARPTGKDDAEWRPAIIVAKYGDEPWGKALDGKPGAATNEPQEATAAKDVTVPPGFAVELLYTVPKMDQGSWVALTTDPKGRLIACDQYGAIYRMTVPPIGKTETLKPEKLTVTLGKAHGLLFAFDALYAMVNEDGANNGLYRATDTNGDDQFDKVERLMEIKGGGEHGLHSMVVSPDGKRIFFNCGNHAELPASLSRARPAQIWDEDHILPRMWDANGHARGRMAPGGYIASMNPDGSDIELFCYGFRNEFDIAFDANGELFTYDADMEWDIGSPWYRPTRVNHCVSGADYGWRSGSGKWPGYYPDSLPTTIDIGPGSPTGVVSGNGAKFPAKYQRAIFINDWTYGTMWAIHLSPQGASFTAEKEEFVFAKPLPLTDVIIRPRDGAMYFAIGGRRTQSGVYRVTYVGSESTAPVAPLPLDEETHMRRTLEQFHTTGAPPEKVIETAWPYLRHSDRHVRYAARVAIEKQPVDLWRQRALVESHPQAVIEATIALARVSGDRPAPSSGKPAGASSPGVSPVKPEKAELQRQMLDSLASLQPDKLNLQQLLGTLRALQLVIIRLGIPDSEVCDGIAERLEPLYPSPSPLINRELCQILVAIGSPKAPAATLALMATARDDFEDVASDAVLSRNDRYATAAREAAGSRPNSQQISYMFALRNATAGWTPELRRTYFSWFPRARTWKGGNSFKGFIENIRKEALTNFVPENERADLDALSSRVEAVASANYVAPKGPGRAWTVDEIVSLAAGRPLKDRDIKNGEAMYRAVMCATCHRFNGDGGSIGPDLTGVGNRYTIRDLAENIVDPSKVISDQYDSHEIITKDGGTVIGRIVVEENGKVFVMANPFAPTEQIALNEADIKSKTTRNVSMMPPGLINALNPEELLDLLAYMVQAGTIAK